MVKGLYQKSIRISEKPKKGPVSVSFVEGAKPSKTPKPKSLTPMARKK